MESLLKSSEFNLIEASSKGSLMLANFWSKLSEFDWILLFNLFTLNL